MSRPIASALAVTALSLTGCEVNPKAALHPVSSYQDVFAQDGALAATFYMQGSRVEIAFKNTAEAGKPARYTFTVADIPVEDMRRRFVLLSRSDLWSRTTLVVAKRPNTDLIASVGSEVTDRREELIRNVAGIAKAVLGVAVASGGAPLSDFSATWTLRGDSDFEAPKDDAEWLVYTSTKHPGLELRLGRPPVTAIAYSPKLLGPPLAGIHFAACRPVVITYKPEDGPETYRWEGKISDADYLEFTPMPRKGKVEFHAQCGVSVTSEKDPTASLDAVVATGVAQGIAVIEAYENAKKK